MAKTTPKKARYLFIEGQTYDLGDGQDAEARALAQQALDTANSKPDIDDSTPSATSVYSSEKVESIKALYLTSVACSAMTGDFATVSNEKITADHVVASVVFANPAAITTNVSWTTASGSLVLNGTCSTATTADIVLVKKNN